MNKTAAYLPTKHHYEILDGLRGVAAVLVVVFHVFETYAADRFSQIVNHGYLAVDFFFVLSGFVVAYAYDDRWTKMSLGDFFRRRLVRLQPMVLAGSVVGAALFYFQSGTVFPLIAGTPAWKMLLVMLVGFTMIPLPLSADIRGWQEMYPLNGPGWSLFFEYIANILYALVVRRLSKFWLGLIVFLSACFLIQYLLFGPTGDVIGGWSLDPVQLHIGFARVLYPFFAGVLLSRIGLVVRVRSPFAVCSLILAAILCFPRLGGSEHLWLNGLYESLCILVLFPLVVAIGAGGVVKEGTGMRLCRFLGGISYPIYITHYPLIYLYISWVAANKVPMGYGLGVGFLLLVTSIALAYLCLKFYDEPVRRWLNRRLNVKGARVQTDTTS